MRPKRSLLRLALAPPAGGQADDRVVADPAAVRGGRGAYVCDAACYERALARRALSRAFRRPVQAGRDTLESPEN